MENLIYVVAAGESLLISLLLTPLFARIARRTGFLDHPGDRKIQSEPVPYLGGAAIFSSFYLVILGNLLLLVLLSGMGRPGGSPIGRLIAEAATHLDGLSRVAWRLSGLLLGGAIAFTVGLLDDRHHLRPLPKLIGQILAALVFCLGLYMEGERHFLITGSMWFFVPVIVWMLAVMNAFNFIDNMDGLAGGVAAIAAFFFAGVCYVVGQRQTFMILSFLTMVGAILGFLRYNWNPARIFMGDAGSLFLGYMIAALAVLTQYVFPEEHGYHAVFVPAVILSLPMFDMVTVMAIRIRRGLPVYRADKNHFSHRLVTLGLSQRDAVLFIYLVALCTGLGALVLPSVGPVGAVLLLLQIPIIFTIILILERVGADRKDNFAPLVILLLIATITCTIFLLEGLRSK